MGPPGRVWLPVPGSVLHFRLEGPGLCSRDSFSPHPLLPVLPLCPYWGVGTSSPSPGTCVTSIPDPFSVPPTEASSSARFASAVARVCGVPWCVCGVLWCVWCAVLSACVLASPPKPGKVIGGGGRQMTSFGAVNWCPGCGAAGWAGRRAFHARNVTLRVGVVE